MDRHTYYPDPGWQWKWMIALLIFVTAVVMLVLLVMSTIEEEQDYRESFSVVCRSYVDGKGWVDDKCSTTWPRMRSK